MLKYSRMKTSKLTNYGRTNAATPIIIASVSFISVVIVGYLIYASLNTKTTNVATPQDYKTSTSKTDNTTYAILKPASVPSKLAECSATLSYDSNGNPSPIQCSNGALNIQAWNALAALEPTVMKLGYSPTQKQVQNGICLDGNAANQDSTAAISAPLETSVYQLSSLYYGWHFSINPTQLLTSGC